MIKIREYNSKDFQEVLSLFKNSIMNINVADYDPIQIEKWAGSIKDEERWARRLRENVSTMVATIEDRLVGFSSLETWDHLDLLYVDWETQRFGIARSLITTLIELAKEHKSQTIKSDVSITAKGFFERMGWRVIRKQTVTIDQISFINYLMELNLRK